MFNVNPDLISTHLISQKNDIDAALSIRRRVFIEEQQVSEAEEIDGLDAECTHYAVKYGADWIATARLYWVSSEKVKIQRVAVLKEYRGQSIGKKLIEFMLNDLKKTKRSLTVVLGAQISAVSFYEKLGFQSFGEPYLDARILHCDMTQNLNHL